jgi:hypothetical protein
VEGFIDPPEFAQLLDTVRALEPPDIADVAEFAYLTCLRRGIAPRWRNWETQATQNQPVMLTATETRR